ncbi:MAG: hypothetical protein R2910_08035 [Gemmatimonadales bacterium]|jgi:hypothetical protein
MGRSLPVLEPDGDAPDPLEAEGWERRFIAVGARLDESVKLYEQLGFAVRLELPTAQDLREECGDCHAALQLYRVVYTRRPA